MGVGVMVGLVKPGGSPMAVGVADDVGVGAGVWAEADSVNIVPIMARATNAQIHQVSPLPLFSGGSGSLGLGWFTAQA